MTGCTGTETDKQIGLWERRVKGLRRMLLGWDQAKPPDPPNSVLVDVIGPSSVFIRIYEPVEGPLGTKFKGNFQSYIVYKFKWKFDHLSRKIFVYTEYLLHIQSTWNKF